MEFLLAKGLIAEAYLSRLPVGHTHEDIDAQFGHIWTWFRSTPCLSLDQYREGIEECFRTSIVRLTFKDIYVVPNYFEFMRGQFDVIDRWAKRELTVHQIYFSRVPLSVYFPLGVRVMYRDYISPRVVELKPVEKNRAATRIGQLTGFDPVTHYSRWYPDENTIPFRSVAGFYLLHVGNILTNHFSSYISHYVNFPYPLYLPTPYYMNFDHLDHPYDASYCRDIAKGFRSRKY